MLLRGTSMLSSLLRLEMYVGFNDYSVVEPVSHYPLMGTGTASFGIYHGEQGHVAER